MPPKKPKEEHELKTNRLSTKHVQEKGEKTQADQELVPSPSKDRVSFQEVIEMGVFQSGRQASKSLFDKFNDDHIHKYLDYIQRDDDHEHRLKNTNRFFHLAYVLIAVALFGFLVIYLLPKDKALLNDILKFLLGFIGGFGGGFGAKFYLDRKKTGKY